VVFFKIIAYSFLFSFHLFKVFVKKKSCKRFSFYSHRFVDLSFLLLVFCFPFFFHVYLVVVDLTLEKFSRVNIDIEKMTWLSSWKSLKTLRELLTLK
jgi:energy-coupling factor transporter transmembrane protein EcfT